MKEERNEKTASEFLPIETIERHIYTIRGRKVILSTHLSSLYDAEPKVLIQAVKRNYRRFPDDFMFQLSSQEFEILKSQIVTSRWGGLRRAMPYAFTEQGVAMLSSVLNSDRAIEVNIAIMRVFTHLREMLASHVMLLRRLDELEKEQKEHGMKIEAVFEAIRKLGAPDDEDLKNPIGFQN